MYNGKTSLTCESFVYNCALETLVSSENIWSDMSYSDTTNDTAYIGDQECSFIGYMTSFGVTEGSSTFQQSIIL